MKTTEEYIVSKGYKEYPTSEYDSPYVIKNFQKRFTDNNGTKYFINISKWDIKSVSSVLKDRYEFSYNIYFTASDCDNPIKIELYAGWELDDVEKHIEKLWNTGLYKNDG